MHLFNIKVLTLSIYAFCLPLWYIPIVRTITGSMSLLVAILSGEYRQHSKTCHLE